MTTLIYRGKTYVQNKEVVTKQLIELKYRRNIYKQRSNSVSSNNASSFLTYRGVTYQK